MMIMRRRGRREAASTGIQNGVGLSTISNKTNPNFPQFDKNAHKILTGMGKEMQMRTLGKRRPIRLKIPLVAFNYL